MNFLELMEQSPLIVKVAAAFALGVLIAGLIVGSCG